jgi:signal transduction histidine kinase
MASIFDDFHGGPQSELEKTNFGLLSAALGITLISLALSVFRLERKSAHWKTLDVQLHLVAGVGLATGWGLFVYRVNRIDLLFKNNSESVTSPTAGINQGWWFGKAFIVLVTEALVIPLYFVLPYMILKSSSAQDVPYTAPEQATGFHSQHIPATTIHNHRETPLQIQFYNQQQAQTPPPEYFGKQQLSPLTPDRI